MHLADQELEEALELVCVAAQAGVSPAGSTPSAGSSVRTSTWSSFAEPLDAPEHADRVARLEAPVEHVDVVPDARRDPAARVDELEREIARAVPRPQPFLARDGVDALNGAVFLQFGDSGHEREFRMAG